MMLRVNNEYLDFNGSVELDRKAKLFEELDSVDGDVSFEFELELTSHNAKVLSFPFPDVSTKKVYTIQNTDLLNEEGQLLSRGYIKVERKIDDILFCSFLGGNSNWFAMLTGSLRDLQGESVIITQANIEASWTNTDGIIFPLVDTGMLSLRGHNRLTIDDFHPFLYAKTLVKTIFQKYSIKLAGDLLTDWRYNNITLSSGIDQEEQAQTLRVFANKTGSTPVDNTAIPIPFEDVSDPFFSPADYNSVTGEFTAPYRMVVRVKATVNFSDSSDLYQLTIYINNQPVSGKVAYSPEDDPTATIEYDILLAAGNTLTVDAEVRNAGGTANAISGTLEITPIYILNLSGYSEFLPDWTEGEFISSLFTLLNVIPSYEAISKTLTLDLFDNLKHKEPIDISEHVSTFETDYTEFISNYAKINKFLYDADPEAHGSGAIPSSNDFLEEDGEVLNSDFFTRPSYKNKSFKTQVEKMEFVQEYVYKSTTINSISDSSGTARFNVTSTSLLSGDNLIRIETENELYNGDYVIGTVGVGFFEIENLSFIANDTGTAQRILQVPDRSNDFHILLVVRETDISSFADISQYYFYNDPFSSIAYAYFNLWNEGRVINELYKQSLFFSPDGTENFYQQTLIDSYWNTFSRILNDPVVAKATCTLPWVVHNKIDFLRPILIKTLDTTNLYYCNLERGYQNSYTSCDLSLIKLP